MAKGPHSRSKAGAAHVFEEDRGDFQVRFRPEPFWPHPVADPAVVVDHPVADHPDVAFCTAD